MTAMYQGGKGLTVALLSVFLCFSTSFEVKAQAVPKVGTCPSGYHTSGGACVPSSRERVARPALPKIGTCPSGYHTSGDYCLGSSADAKHAMPKAGSCPSGYHASGAYCLSNR
jgi:hypothetical protein